MSTDGYARVTLAGLPSLPRPGERAWSPVRPYSSPDGRRRARFRSPARRFASSRRSRDARVGRVGLRLR